jgi:hypothetical protein
MRYIELPGKIDDENRLILDDSLGEIKPQKVRVDIWFCDEEEEYHEETKEEILDGIREGLHECPTGETQSIEDIWDELRIKTTGVINDAGQLILDRPLKATIPQYVDVVISFIKDNITFPSIIARCEKEFTLIENP